MGAQMNTSIKLTAALVLMAAWSAAQAAQTYDVVESFGTLPNSGFGAFQLSFTGSFTFNPHGTGLCSAPLCAPGVIPDFTNVNMSGTSGTSSIPPWGPDIPGQMALTENGNSLTFVNSNGSPFTSSEVSTLSFNLDRSLGSAKKIDTSGAAYNAFGGGSVNHGLALCGVNSTCSGSVTRVAAPELDFRDAFPALMLIAGTLAVMCGRRAAPQRAA
jgi:hypothetical protein